MLQQYINKILIGSLESVVGFTALGSTLLKTPM